MTRYAGAYRGRSYIASRTYSSKEETILELHVTIKEVVLCRQKREIRRHFPLQDSLCIVSLMGFGLSSFRGVCFLLIRFPACDHIVIWNLQLSYVQLCLRYGLKNKDFKYKHGIMDENISSHSPCIGRKMSTILANGDVTPS